MAKRFLMWLLATFVVTLFLCTFLSLKTALILAMICIIVLIPVAFLKFSLKPTVIGCLISAIASVALFVGTALPILRAETALLDQECSIEGMVIELGRNAAKNLDRYQIRLTEVNEEPVSQILPFHIYLYTDSKEDYPPGSTVQGTVTFFDRSVTYGAGREDFVFASAYQEADTLLFLSPSLSNWRLKLHQFRTTVQNRIAYGTEKTQGLLRSICLGDKTELDPSLAVSLRRDGLSHVTAVSGLHLSFTVMLFNFLFLLLGIPYRIRYLLGILVAMFFTALVGFPLSCIRACVMLIIFSLGMALNLFADGLTSLSVAAFLIVLVQPLAVRDVGFLLSVLATGGIITLRAPIENFLFPKKIKERSPRINKVYRSITGILSCSVAVAITTLPVTLTVFGSVSLIAPLANAVLIFPLQLLFMLGIFMVLLGFIPGIGAAIGFACDLLYEGINGVAEFFGRLPFASVSSIDYSGVIMLVLFLGIIGIGLYHFLRYKRRSFVILMTAFLCYCGLYSGFYALSHSAEPVEIAFVNVGQGDCTVVSKGGRAVILDYGGSSEERYNLIEYLKKRNIYTVELLAFTHLHDDHTNGLSTLFGNVYVDQILYPDLEYDSPEILAMMAEQPSSIITDNTPLTVLDNVTLIPIADAALDPALNKENERCVCYRVEYGKTSLLVTGDIEAKAEMKILPSMEDCTLLKVAHHGSATSSMYPFLKAVSPEIAVISAGENTYGLPDEAVLDRLATICPEVYNTQIHGTVLFQTDGTVLERISS